MKHAFVRVMLMALCAMAFVSLAQAQYRASLRGTVTDPQGAVISGAKVTLVDTNTNKTLVSVSDANGIYQFNALPPDQFRLMVEAQGFATKTLDGVHILPEQANGLDLEMKLGGTTDTITVSGTAEALQTESATVSGTVSSNQIQHLPSFGRDVLKLALLAPGAFGDNAAATGNNSYRMPGNQTNGGASGGADGIFKTENGVEVVANGSNPAHNGITLDGISTTSAVWGGATIITPSQDSVQEVRVVTNSYDAQEGRFAGAQVQVISKSGTNQYHGSLFFTAHRPGLNAYQRWNGPGAVQRDNNFFSQIGGSVGGPIWKNKIFAFFSYETVRSPKAQTVTANQWFETPSLIGSAPAGSIASQLLNFAGSTPKTLGTNPYTCAQIGLTEGVNCNTTAQGLDIGSPLTSALGTQDLGWTSQGSPGVGNGLDGVADIANYIVQSSTTFSKAAYNGRIDANVSNNDRVGFTIYWVPQSNSFLNGPARPYDFFNHSQINNAFTAIWDHTFSPTLLNEFRVNAAGWRWNEIASNPQSPVGLPTDYVDSIGNGTVGLSNYGPNVGSILNQWTYSFNDIATKVAGRHTLKFGADVTRLFYLNQCAGCGHPSYNFFNLWDFVNDAPHTEYAVFDPNTGSPTTQRLDQRENILGFFVQDDFKLRPNLTVTMGLRWSYFGPLTAKQGQYVATPGSGSDYLTGLTVRKQSAAWNAQKDNFGPQIGVAWSPGRFHDKLVVRGGYGLNYNQEEIALTQNTGTNPGLAVFNYLNMNTPTSANPGIVYGVATNPNSLAGFPPTPAAVVSFGPNGLPTTGSVGVFFMPPNLPTMRVHHYSLQADYEFAQNWVASLGYQGSLTRNLYFHENPSAAPAAAGDPINPQIAYGDFWGVSGWGNYNAMLAEVRHQFSHQFTADAQFTWAKSMDTSTGPYSEQPYVFDTALNYGRSDFNVGKAFKLYGLWQPVIFRGERGWLEKIVGGWSIGGMWLTHSGFPWTPTYGITGGNLYCGICGYGSLFPAAYLGGAGNSTSNDAYKTGSNFSNPANTYFTGPTYTAYTGTNSGTALPQAPGVRRNSFTGPGFRDVDLTLAKAFGLPKMPVLGEDAKFEFRMDAYNVFNSLNINPGSISNFICAIDSTGTCLPGSVNGNFGRANQGLAGRVITLGARFNF